MRAHTARSKPRGHCRTPASTVAPVEDSEDLIRELRRACAELTTAHQVQLTLATIGQIARHTLCLRDDELACSEVPDLRAKIPLPVPMLEGSIETARSNICHVEARRARH